MSTPTAAPRERLSVLGWLALPLVGLVWLYQKLISPFLPPTCRFTPSCSAYAVTALRRYGPFKGTWLAGRRLLRCNPWNPGGVDHVPHKHAVPASPSSVTLRQH